MGASHQEQPSHQPAEVAAAGGREHSSGIGSTALSTFQVGRCREGGVDHRPLNPVKWIVKVLLAVCRSAPEIEQTITAGSPRPSLAHSMFASERYEVERSTSYFPGSVASRQDRTQAQGRACQSIPPNVLPPALIVSVNSRWALPPPDGRVNNLSTSPPPLVVPLTA